MAKVKRKPRAGESDRLREPVKLFAEGIWRNLGWNSPTAVEKFSDLIEVPCDAKSAHRYIRHAKQKHREALAAALVNASKRD
jgi:hypothetical protein